MNLWCFNPVFAYYRSPCSTGDLEESIESYIGDYGEWGSSKSCPTGYYLSGASVRSEPDQGMLDDAAGMVGRFSHVYKMF